MAVPTQSKHHVKDFICATRKKYRDGRRDTAIKVYTVNQESRYLLVQGVPALGNLHNDLVKLFALYGPVIEYRLLDDYATADKYTDVYWIKFEHINHARIAKRKMDDFSFYGGVLHVCYCPEYETVDDTREKLKQRRISIAARIHKLKAGEPSTEQNVTSSGVYTSTTRDQTTRDHTQPDHTQPDHIHTQPDHTQPYHITPSATQPSITYNKPTSFITATSPENIPCEYTDTISLSLPVPPRRVPPWAITVKHKPDLDHARVPPKQFSTCVNNSNKRSYNRLMSQPDIKPSRIVLKKPMATVTTAPRFVPRQNVKRVPMPKPGTCKTGDKLDEAIKLNAFILGKISGPANMNNNGIVEVTMSDKTKDSMEETRMAIREKLKKFTEFKLSKAKRMKPS